ncbi:MAG: DUF4347 domain-containing protein [Sedimentisphaerales bacterium]|nr:DUF4347 domain-containing protein [Sedimentisphaerales bacterium]
MLAGWWSCVGAKRAGYKPGAVRLPLIEPLEPRLLLSADSLGLEPVPAVSIPLDEPVVCIDLGQNGETADADPSAILTYLASPSASVEPEPEAETPGPVVEVMAVQVEPAAEPVVVPLQGEPICLTPVDRQDDISRTDGFPIEARGPPAGVQDPLSTLSATTYGEEEQPVTSAEGGVVPATSGPFTAAPLNVVLVSDAVVQAEQIQRAAASDTIAIIYHADTMTVTGLVDLLASVSAAHNGARIGHLGIVAHGGPGEIELGTGENLTLATLPSQAPELGQLRSVLTCDARLDLYSCSVAAGTAGKTFVDELGADTGATVFASDNPVGTVLGADFIWEYRAGPAATGHELFSLQEIEAISGVRLTDRTEPAAIRVGPYPNGPATSVDFNTYVQDVLPNEWLIGADWNWPAEAYKAGAIAVKMYGWWRIQNPVSSSMDVYSDDHDQVYVAGSGQESRALQYTDPAIAAVRTVGMERVDGQLFKAMYWNGACNVASGGANLRPAPTTNNDPITFLDGGTDVYVIDNGEHYADGHWWFQVAVNGVYPSSTTDVGYVAADLLTCASIGGNPVADMRGRLTQYGTVYWANQGWNYQDILHYFYDGSTVTGEQNVDFFNVSAGTQDITPPTIAAFDVTPSTITVGNSVTISYKVSDTGGSHLKQVELWRAPDVGGSEGTWAPVGTPRDISAYGDGPAEGTFSDGSLLAAGGYWYGIHVLDGENNYCDDRTESYWNATEGTDRIGPIYVAVSQAQNTVLSISTPGAISEGDTGSKNLRFTVQLSGTPQQFVDVDYATFDGNATAGVDYTAVSGHLQCAPGETNAFWFVTVPIIGDYTIEPDETFFVNLSNASNATISDGQGVGTILNDDTAVFQFSSATYSVNENGGSITVTITKTGNASGVGMSYATSNGTAMAGSDFASTSGTLTFNAGDTSKTFTVPIINDSVPESSEAFNVALSGATGGSSLGTPSSAVVTIADDDSAQLSMSTPAAITEGDIGSKNLAFTVALSPSSAQTVTVNYATSNGTATAGSDYTATNGTLTFSPSQTSQQINVPILGDYVIEGDETFTMTLSGATNATIATGTATGTIQNDDAAGTLTLSSSTYNVNEDGGTVTITVDRSGGLASGVGVSYATSNGTATAGSDYTSASGTLTFNGGETSKTFTVPILQDSLVEGNETFNVALHNATGEGTLGSPSSAVVTILDDDVQGLVVAPGSVSVPEGGTAQFTMKLAAQPASNVTVAITKQPGGDADLSVVTSSLTFTTANWDTYQPVTLSAAEDADTTNGTATIHCSASGLADKDVTATEQDNDVLSPVWRFWSSVNSVHFYTISEAERDMLIRDWQSVWTYEGVAYQAYVDGGQAGTAPIYRFWSGHSHFYTISEAERDMLIRDWSSVWTYEGIAFYAYPEGQQPEGSKPVYRFWNGSQVCHFYTMSEDERDMIIRDFSHVFSYEGVAWYAEAPLDGVALTMDDDAGLLDFQSAQANTGESQSESWPSLPGMRLVDQDPANLTGQIIYLDFDGEQNVVYNGPVTVGPFDIPAFHATGSLAGQEQTIIRGVLGQLQQTFADCGVVFTVDKPSGGVLYSSVYIGGDDSAFGPYGSFLGLAEQVDVGNRARDDDALVFTDYLNQYMLDLDSFTDRLTRIIAHEVGHLFGYAHA